MYCPFCHANETRVVDSRLVAEGAQVKRRRECVKCRERFTTFETAELLLPMIIKGDNRREVFCINKLRAGMLRALEKRPVGVDALEAAIESIIQEVRRSGEREISSLWVGEQVMRQLYRLDDVAYVRFASVYKRFKDVSDFKNAIDQLSENGE